MVRPIRIEYLLRWLKSYSREQDKTAFNKWEEGLIDIDECIHIFRKNNEITERMPIIKEEFEGWLNSLGYFRR